VTGKLRKRIAGTGTALVLAITFGVMGTTGIAIAGGGTTTTASLAEAQTFGNSPTCRLPMLVHIPQ
jgi:hypothetical protein